MPPPASDGGVGRWVEDDGRFKYVIGIRIMYYVIFDPRTDLWYAHQRAAPEQDGVLWESFGSGTLEDMTKLVEVTAKFEQ